MKKDWLAVAVLACVLATFVHHVHNAEFLEDYPNMPTGLSRAGLYAAWLGAVVVGITGYVLVQRAYRIAGLVLLAAYACYSLDGLAHYALAPVSAHTAAMNLTIWLEAIAGAGLLTACAMSNKK